MYFNIRGLFDGDFLPRERGLFDRGFAPTVDVIENTDDITVTCDIPGVDKKDIDISLSGNSLIIKGEKKGESEKKNARVYQRENWYGGFQRTLPLPNSVETDKVSAEMKNGVLTITLPKKEDAKRKQITVNVN